MMFRSRGGFVGLRLRLRIWRSGFLSQDHGSCSCECQSKLLHTAASWQTLVHAASHGTVGPGSRTVRRITGSSAGGHGSVIGDGLFLAFLAAVAPFLFPLDFFRPAFLWDAALGGGGGFRRLRRTLL